MRCETCTKTMDRVLGPGAARQWYCAGCGRWEPPIEPDTASEASDTVNHPSHYTSGGVEVIDAIEAWGLGFRLGNAVKYIARAGKKDPAKVVEDLRKARWYLDREIAKRGG